LKTPEDYFYALFKKVCKLSENLSNDASIKNINSETDSKTNKEVVEKVIETTYSERHQAVNLEVSFLHRKSVKERVFVPPPSIRNQETQKIDLNFISIYKEEFGSNIPIPMKFHKIKDINNDCPRNTIQQPEFQACSSDSFDNRKRIYVNIDKCSTSYKPLKVKRVQGNEFRTKATKLSKSKKNANI
jgi:hypothetical protein